MSEGEPGGITMSGRTSNDSLNSEETRLTAPSFWDNRKKNLTR